MTTWIDGRFLARNVLAVAVAFGAGILPGPKPSAAGVLQAQTYVYEVWAYDLLRDPSDFGHHRITIVAASEQEALIRLQLYMSAWGDQLRAQGQHYNGINSRPISRS